MFIVFFLLGLLLTSKDLYSQTKNEYLISSTGGYIQSDKVHIDYTLGEVAISTFYSEKALLNEGFLQYYKGKISSDSSESVLKVFEFVTPNGDGKNDVFFVNGIQEFPDNELMILNKWGNVVFKCTQYSNTWDGGELSDGSYFYVLKIPSKKLTFLGGFALIR